MGYVIVLENEGLYRRLVLRDLATLVEVGSMRTVSEMICDLGIPMLFVPLVLFVLFCTCPPLPHVLQAPDGAWLAGWWLAC